MKLFSGIDVRIDSVHCSTFLSGIIEGRPSWIYTAVVREAALQAKKMWGERPTYLIPPPPLKNDATLRDFPTWVVWVWLKSSPMSPDDDGSELVVIFFCDTLKSMPIPQFVESKIRDLDWLKLASGYQL